MPLTNTLALSQLKLANIHFNL